VDNLTLLRRRIAQLKIDQTVDLSDLGYAAFVSRLGQSVYRVGPSDARSGKPYGRFRGAKKGVDRVIEFLLEHHSKKEG
jgi:ADP-heptose:LPS heptosyltransferase